MNDAATPAVRSQIKHTYFSEHWPAIAFTVIVLAMFAYAFAPRPAPEFKPTQIYPDRIIINGLATNGERIIAVGEHGNILIGEGKASWTNAAVTPQRGSTLTAVRFLDNSTAVAVGHDSWILRSQDGGKNWKESFFDAKEGTVLLGMAGPFANRLFAFGAYGLFMSSQDAGKTWTRGTFNVAGAAPAPAPAAPEPSSDPFSSFTGDTNAAESHLNAMAQAADGSLIVVGERGLIARSRDNGQSWSQLPQIYRGSFFGIQPLPSGALLVYGMRGHAFLSRDNGNSWQPSVVPQSVSLFGSAVLDNDDVVLVGANNLMFLSKDGGQTFVAMTRRGGGVGLTAVLPLASGKLLTGGEGGLALHDLSSAKGATP